MGVDQGMFVDACVRVFVTGELYFSFTQQFARGNAYELSCKRTRDTLISDCIGKNGMIFQGGLNFGGDRQI